MTTLRRATTLPEQRPRLGASPTSKYRQGRPIVAPKWSLWPRPRNVLPGGREENLSGKMSMTGGRRHERKRAWKKVPAPLQRPVDASDGTIHVVGDTYSSKAGLCGT